MPSHTSVLQVLRHIFHFVCVRPYAGLHARVLMQTPPGPCESAISLSAADWCCKLLAATRLGTLSSPRCTRLHAPARIAQHILSQSLTGTTYDFGLALPTTNV